MLVGGRKMGSVQALVLSLSFCALLRVVRGHPQCLDSQPPFADPEMTVCHEYRDFGCCTRRFDRRAGLDARLALDKFSTNQDREVCQEYMRNISCLSCSPYAAHIFETEGGNEKISFPQLCRNYCAEAYVKCHLGLMRLFRLLPWRDGLVSKRPKTPEDLQRDAEVFCRHYIPEDSAYCYPEVLDGPDVEGFSTEQVGELGCLCGEPVARGLRNPLAAVHAGDGSGRLFIVEQIGVIHVLDRDNNLLSDPFLDITDRVIPITRTGDERGLLGLAFHPNYATNKLFYVYYSVIVSSQHLSRVSEFRVNDSNANRADGDSERVVFEVRQPFSNHNGGQLLFKDGYLLIFLGDGGSARDPRGHGQNRGTLLGSVLRIDVNGRDSGKEYAVPPDNPFVGEADARGEIWAYGLRNPWRCSVDRGDPVTGHGAGRLFCGDVGQGAFEEVDIVERGGNYGWKIFEGNTCTSRSSSTCSSIPDAIRPIHVYPHSVGVSVTGGYIYRGCTFPNLQGLYIFGDFGSGRMFGLRENVTSGEWEHMELCMGDEGTCTGGLVGASRERFILSFGEDEEGELYVLTSSRANARVDSGVVYRIVDPSRRSAPGTC